MNAVINFLRKLFGLDGSRVPVEPQPADPCTAPACVDAKSRLADARARFVSTCNALRSVTYLAKLVSMVIAVPIWVIVVLIVVATILWFLGLGFLAILLWALVLVYVLAWFLRFVIGRLQITIGQSLFDARDAVGRALQDVVAQCPKQCQGDLTIPVCTGE